MSTTTPSDLTTRVLDANDDNHGQFHDPLTKQHWHVSSPDNPARKALHRVAQYMRTSDIPVGFPTETVYGLGADATRSEAVRGIYKAKGRPSDNPLIIHISDLDMLTRILDPSSTNALTDTTTTSHNPSPIPAIYLPLITRFWPGPLTILLPNPSHSPLAPEVTASLPTFGVRMPSSPLALSLISLVGQPLAAPSANASTKPSPTTATHVLHDLSGKIQYILDGGPCSVGVESTVVDGLCNPPQILRPGGLSLQDIRSVEGWQATEKGYKDKSEVDSAMAPRAPGMKYKHYSPKAKVVLFEHGASFDPQPYISTLPASDAPKVGIIKTFHWDTTESAQISSVLASSEQSPNHIEVHEMSIAGTDKSSMSIAQNLFAALRTMDLQGADLVFVEGVDEEGDVSAAVMNRLRKAASVIVGA